MKNSKKAGVTAAVLTGILLTGAATAYFTDGDSATNEFTVGKISLDLIEPGWNPEAATAITPNLTLTKDPQVTNDGNNSEFVFLSVTVPYARIVTAGADGSRNEAADTELFYYTKNENWVEIGTPVKDEEAGTVTHVYAYGTDTSCQALNVASTTPALFQNITFANVVEDQTLEGVELDVEIKAYGIQSTNINGGKTAPDEVWRVLSKELPDTAASSENPVTDAKIQV